jgi:uncharacterized protein YbjT (DUF2867 family)
MNKTAVVMGATGLVGSALVNQLANAEYIAKVITLTRKSTEHASSKVVNHVVDFDHLENYAELFEADLLFSCLGTTLKQAGSIEAQRKVDIDYQLKAAELAVSNSVSHYLLISSSGASPQSKSAYLKMKGELEQSIKTLPFKRISIFQPSLLLGKRSADFRLAETVASWILPVLSVIPGIRKYRPITGEQVAARMVLTSHSAGEAIEVFQLDEIFIK